MGGDEGCRVQRRKFHTLNPADEAQTLVPSTLKMAALSILPVPTRLQWDQHFARSGNGEGGSY